MSDYKEYLEKHTDGTYALVLRGNACKGDDIEVPEGMNYAYDAGSFIQFTKQEMGYRDSALVWQRELRAMVSPMKEYLDSNRNYEFVLSTEKEEGFIEIPEGAECLTKCKDHNDDEWLLFWKGDYKFCVGHDKEWVYFEAGVSEYLSDWCGLANIIWQREQDEPFLTPECTLNDQYAEIEEVRQQSIEATLAERQSTYGNFEDVAFLTENIMSILAKVRVNGLDDLPNTHRMALYMIASKMARIVNGDFNHLDSWHDIGGYSKLIEKLIKGE